MNAEAKPDPAAGLRLMEDEPDRRRYIGSSDAAAILGLSNFRTPYDVYLAKTSETREEMDPAKRKFLERRKRWEPVVVQMLREELEAEIVSINRRYIDREHDYFAAEVDAEALDSGEIMNVEIKTVHPRAFGERYGWGEAGSGDIPVDYEAQVQFALGVTGRSQAIVAAMVGLDDMVFYRIERDDETIATLRAACSKFWTEHVVAKVAPEPTTIEDLHRLYRKSTPGLSVAATDDVGSKALQLRAARAQISAIELQIDALEFDVKLAMKDAEELFVDGRKIFTWKEQAFSYLDQTALKEKEKETHRKFTISGKRRVFKSLTS